MTDYYCSVTIVGVAVVVAVDAADVVDVFVALPTATTMAARVWCRCW